MAEKYLKIIQNGVESFVPDTKRTRDFWTKQNSKVVRSYAAQRETVTIVPAKDEEVAFMTNPVALSKAIEQAPAAPVVDTSKLESLEAKLAQQQELITLLLKKQNEDTSDTEQKERGKPGPKPKTKDNGESQETSTQA